MSLLTVTKKLLREEIKRGTKVRVIAAACDSKHVQVEWLYRFARKEIDNPGINGVQALHDGLKKFKQKSVA